MGDDDVAAGVAQNECVSLPACTESEHTDARLEQRVEPDFGLLESLEGHRISLAIDRWLPTSVL